jgi:hypothetical protein
VKLIPNRVEIEHNNHNTVIIFKGRDLVYTDYLLILITGFLLAFIVFVLLTNELEGIYVLGTFLCLVGYMLLRMVLSIFEKHIITINDSTVEIIEKGLLFTDRKIMDIKYIEKVYLKEVKARKMVNSNILLKFKISVVNQLGFFKMPTIQYNGNDIYFIKYHNAIIKSWIIDYLNLRINN